jgi:hypothetical protein
MIMSSKLARLIVAMLLLGTVSARGGAQSAPRDARGDQTSALMTPGAHVRIKLPREQPWSGTLVSLTGDTMLVKSRSGKDTMLVSLSQLSQLQVSAGMRRSRHLVRNTVVMTGIGAGLGWLVGASMTHGGCGKSVCWLEDEPYPPFADRASGGTVIGGLTGGAIALLGGWRRSEDWQPVHVTCRRASMTVSPGGGRVAIAF